MSKKRSEMYREQRRQQALREAAERKRRDGETGIVKQCLESASKLEEFERKIDKNKHDFLLLNTRSYQPSITLKTMSAAWEGDLGDPSVKDEPAPTFSECVVGYRQWVVDAVGQLRAVTMAKQVWVPGENVAKCRPFDCAGTTSFLRSAPLEEHAAPAEHCACGFYGWIDLRVASGGCAYFDDAGRLWVTGGIAVWGDLRVHADGFRASRACPVALAYDDETTSRVRDVLRRVTDDYRVALVHVDALQAEVEQYGSPLPQDVRPKSDRKSYMPGTLLYGTSTFITPEGWALLNGL